MSTQSRLFGALGAAFIVALAGLGCTSVLGDITFDRSTGGTGGGGASSSSSGTGGMGGGGASSSSSGTGGGSTCANGLYEHPAGSGTCIDDPCLPDSPCGEFGTCENGTGAAVCACQPGFIGAACDTCVYFVSGSAAGAGTGASWKDAFTTIQPALDAAGDKVSTAGEKSCDVWVQQGTYYVYAASKGDTIYLRANVGLYGGFAGTETLRTEAKPKANPTILDGRKNASSGLEVKHVVQIADVAGTAIDGFTIQNGNADGTGGSPEDSAGGGILLYSFHTPAFVAVSNCEITANTGIYGGGISMVFGGSFTMTDCDLHHNTATASGGGGICGGTSCTVKKTKIRSNSAPSGAGFSAGTILLASDVTFSDNLATSDGGGLLLNGPFTGSSLTNVIFSGNRASGLGGGARVTSSTGSATMFNAVFVGNSASAGGAVSDDTPGGFGCEGCTITRNQGTSGGDGIQWANGGPTLTDTIVWGNPSSAGTGKDVDPATAAVVASHSDIHGFTGTGAGMIDADPVFASLPKSFDHATVDAADLVTVNVAASGLYKIGDVVEIGGDGVARAVSASAGNVVTFGPALTAAAAAGTAIRNWGTALGTIDLRLGAASPCVDAADPGTAPTTDVTGAARIGAGPDIGAYESH